jgi:hypothetical protein
MNWNFQDKVALVTGAGSGLTRTNQHTIAASLLLSLRRMAGADEARTTWSHASHPLPPKQWPLLAIANRRIALRARAPDRWMTASW